ncbi:MAG: binding domain, partial [Pseudonocardiales bacterium]|nr:binding domain [Pseudonocardiales bacterium]
MRVAVVGGGPAGCAAAYTLRKQGHEVMLFEAQD